MGEGERGGGKGREICDIDSSDRNRQTGRQTGRQRQAERQVEKES